VRQQISLWDQFLELRIKLQRATITCNCLPSSPIEDDELRQVIDENATLFRKTIALLLAIENRRSSSQVKRKNDDDNEETDNNNATTELFKTISKRLKRGDHAIDQEIDASYENFVPKRDAVIQKWFERTRTFAKQNKSAAVEQSPVVQIKEIMALPDRLLKRTQTSRIDYDFVCPPSSSNHTDVATNENSTGVNLELFDDGDFYHQLLREYIERKTASITDPEQISKHWAQLRKLRSKLKKSVDTLASKDRKIRYIVHKKLVNYMAPIDRCSFTDEAKSDLFSSLFGTNKITAMPTTNGQPIVGNDIRLI